MKKAFYIPTIVLAAIAMSISGCQKTVFESNNAGSKALPDAVLQNQCQLTRLVVPGFHNQFRYNEKGLVDEWSMHFGDGIPQVYSMNYDNNNKLTQAWMHYQGDLIATINFTWTGNLLTNEHWNWLGFEFDYVNTYDNKGQRIESEGTDGFSTTTKWSPIGNAEQTDIFLNGVILQSGEYTFNQPNKNPYLAVRGLPYGFPLLNLTFSKWWETSEKISINDGGAPLVVYELDPLQTVFQFGSQNYLAEANHFDIVSNSAIDYSFEYQNCGPANNNPARMSGSQSQASTKKSGRPVLLKMGSSELISKQLKERRK